VVKSGDMPFYPQLPRVAQIEGDVRLRITTDGSAVKSVTVESGQPMLARAALDNVKSWKFHTHQPISFSTVFSYHLAKELVTYSCDPDIPDNGTVFLSSPPRWTPHHTSEFRTAMTRTRGLTYLSHRVCS